MVSAITASPQSQLVERGPNQRQPPRPLDLRGPTSPAPWHSRRLFTAPPGLRLPPSPPPPRAAHAASGAAAAAASRCADLLQLAVGCWLCLLRLLLLRLLLEPEAAAAAPAGAVATEAAVVMGDVAALMPDPPNVCATPHTCASTAEPVGVHNAAVRAPLLHGLPELHHIQALAGVPVLVLEHGNRLLVALGAEAPHQGRGLFLLHLAIAVGIRLHEEAWLFLLGTLGRLLLLGEVFEGLRLLSPFRGTELGSVEGAK